MKERSAEICVLHGAAAKRQPDPRLRLIIIDPERSEDIEAPLVVECLWRRSEIGAVPALQFCLASLGIFLRLSADADLGCLRHRRGQARIYADFFLSLLLMFASVEGR